MHNFFLERFLQPADWFEKRLAYTRSVAASSMVSLCFFCEIDFDLSLKVNLSFLYIWIPVFIFPDSPFSLYFLWV